MTSLQIHPIVPVGTLGKIETIQRRLTWSVHKNVMHKCVSTHSFVSKSSISVSNQMVQRRPVSVSASLSISNQQPCDRVVKDDDQRKEAIVSENLDEWMKESMVDIVKNLKQAPLLVHVYAQEDDRGQERRPQIKTERALAEKWRIMKNEWESGEKRIPDGLIYVEELRDEEDRELNENGNDNSDEDSVEGLTKSWGLIVQGKGLEFGPACYLLKTSRVGAGRGMGLFCTHFCLVRVKNFRESALTQLKGCWL
ncbi:hypothetical protein A4A49_07994 [Nicotiana attenuata]|uniref:DUF7804 domain-containing protein n=1 Tax=Nicotiana attenuata TaxID=49451 RepID=A0A314KTR6_NICAT|nr:hypothetical protein A4A49_07994 [Nicotiana attenuata]